MTKVFPLNATRSEPLVPPITLKQELAKTVAQSQFIEQSRKDILNILHGDDPRLLLILGPCSIHDIEAAKHYANELEKLSEEVSDVFLPVMRVYFEKPRTVLGWKGIMYDPFLDGSHDMNTGLRWTRELLLTLINLQIPTAAEILDPVSAHYFGDLLCWGCIGARTSSSQIHRQVASGLQMPVAFKNNTDGNINIALNGMIAASHPHSYIGINDDGQAALIHTEGNPSCHLVLRGGDTSPNYDVKSVQNALSLLRHAQLPQKLVIDCSHDNSQRDHERQVEVFECVLDQIISGNHAIRGMILESHINEGNQQLTSNPDHLEYAVSLTDSCIDWETTKALVKNAKTKLEEERGRSGLLVSQCS